MIIKRMLDRLIHVFEIRCSKLMYTETCHDLPHFILGFLTASIARINILGMLLAFFITLIYVYYQSADRATSREEDTIIDLLAFGLGMLLACVM